MSTLALFIIAAWISALSILVALLVRQVSLLTHRMDPDYALDGLPRGRRIPSSLADHLPGGSGGVLVLGAGCSPCRKLAYELKGLEVAQPVVALIEGEERSAAVLAAALPHSMKRVVGVEAAHAYSALQLETTPFAFFVDRREISKERRTSWLCRRQRRGPPHRFSRSRLQMPVSRDIPNAVLEEQVPFGRSRLLKGMGLFLFSAVFTGCTGGGGGGGGHSTNCGGIALCGSCSGSVCTSPTCHKETGLCTTGEYCWFSCHEGKTKKCCDYWDGSKYCYCPEVIKSSC
jgi:hypothetical protein